MKKYKDYVTVDPAAWFESHKGQATYPVAVRRYSDGTFETVMDNGDIEHCGWDDECLRDCIATKFVKEKDYHFVPKRRKSAVFYQAAMDSLEIEDGGYTCHLIADLSPFDKDGCDSEQLEFYQDLYQIDVSFGFDDMWYKGIDYRKFPTADELREMRVLALLLADVIYNKL